MPDRVGKPALHQSAGGRRRWQASGKIPRSLRHALAHCFALTGLPQNPCQSLYVAVRKYTDFRWPSDRPGNAPREDRRLS
jgi:hypothetical protein